MIRRLRMLCVLFVLCVLCATSQAQLQKYWVYFLDKGASVPSAGPLALNAALFRRAESQLSPAALARRSKVLPREAVVEADDLPVDQGYLGIISRTGGIVVHTSRWFNAASTLLTSDQVPLIVRLPFVREVVPVHVFRGYPKGVESGAASRAVLHA